MSYTHPPHPPHPPSVYVRTAQLPCQKELTERKKKRERVREIEGESKKGHAGLSETKFWVGGSAQITTDRGERKKKANTGTKLIEKQTCSIGACELHVCVCVYVCVTVCVCHHRILLPYGLWCHCACHCALPSACKNLLCSDADIIMAVWRHRATVH